VSSAEHHKMTT